MLTRLTFSIALATSVLFGTTALAEETGPLQIFVSKDTQSLVVYDGDQVVITSNISTGKAGHTTPSGIFSILEKRKTHFSNLYDSAPMPWMQRITWSGVALHESAHVPRYPASHGCVRMPAKFARTLWGMTRRGFHVVISDREVAPHAMTAADLFKPRYPKPSPDLMSDAELRPTIVSTTSVEVAMNETLPKLGATAIAAVPKDEAPVKILITRASDKDRALTIQHMLTQLGYDVGDHDGILGSKMRAAIKTYQEIHGQKPTGEMTAAFQRSVYKVMNRTLPTGWIYVRRNFKPLFDAPIEISNPEIALGTHFIQAVHVNAAQNSVDWFGVTLDNYINDLAAKRLGITSTPDALAVDAAEQAFARASIPNDIRERIETILGNGSSITITDIGTEHETGLGTDFITVTRKSPKQEG
ncbi:MAG: L,D-transpeptidase catalytic domain protein [Rhizobium sp.]|nr:L,D-transpeptidase catalytic domain protein [Rhizobium sp.]